MYLEHITHLPPSSSSPSLALVPFVLLDTFAFTFFINIIFIDFSYIFVFIFPYPNSS